MLAKVMIVFLPLLALCASQSTGLDNTQQLSPAFRLDWSVITVAGDIIIQIQANTTGWVFLSIDNAQKTLSDVILGGFDASIGLPYVYDMSSTISATGAHGALIVDPSPDVVLQRGFEYPPETVLRVKRSLNTADNADVAIVRGPMAVSWAISDSDDINAPVKAGGLATVTFIP